MDSQAVCDFLNAIPLAELSHKFVKSLPDEVCVDSPEGTLSISPEYVAPLAEAFHAFIAHCIAGIINAGSERDAVLDNEALARAIEAEVADWVLPA